MISMFSGKILTVERTNSHKKIPEITYYNQSSTVRLPIGTPKGVSPSTRICQPQSHQVFLVNSVKRSWWIV